MRILLITRVSPSQPANRINSRNKYEKMSKENLKYRKNETKKLSPEVSLLLKARSTLASLSGALKSRDQSRSKSKDSKNIDRLKTCESEPEFTELRKNKHISRIEDKSRNFSKGSRPRPVSVSGTRFNIDYRSESLPRDSVLRQYDSADDVCVSRLVIPIKDGVPPDIQVHEERPRKKLSFRDPEIVSGIATLGRSNKLMGVNSLFKKTSTSHLDAASSSAEGLDSDLESQAMRIVRTVGQAFEVCHKMQTEQGEPSTSSAVDEAAPSDRVSDVLPSKEPISECGGSESGAVSTSRMIEEAKIEEQCRPKVLPIELLPPPPRKDGRRSPQRVIHTPTVTLPEIPECLTKVEITPEPGGESTPLSAQHQLQLLRERLEQQVQQTRAAVAQLLLLRDQLTAEQAARCEAQARTHQLLVHNKELLEHIAALVAHLQDKERGSSRPISTHQLTFLPQKIEEDINSTSIYSQHCSDNRISLDTNSIMNLITQGDNVKQNLENNNVMLSPFCVSPAMPGTPTNGSSSAPSFGGMSNEQIQNYLISKFQNMGADPQVANSSQQFYQNSTAFPNIPPLTNHYSNSDLASLMNHNAYKENSLVPQNFESHAMSIGQSQNSLYSSQATTSKDSISDAFSSDEGVTFIMPLSHKGTLKTTCEDGRIRLIVPISPSESVSDVPEKQTKLHTGPTLKVPGQEINLASAAPITRCTSEKVPNRSVMMTALRQQWTRHTTK